MLLATEESPMPTKPQTQRSSRELVDSQPLSDGSAIRIYAQDDGAVLVCSRVYGGVPAVEMLPSAEHVIRYCAQIPIGAMRVGEWLRRTVELAWIRADEMRRESYDLVLAATEGGAYDVIAMPGVSA
jgi:hypothetical protein